ncbi:MAG TPA: pyridoxal-phosphate dependent enzyme [Anaerolineales bacterium]|nr:pyridoxal-phosphate dependent enzyme [Anaerolineales bacterium]
MIPSSWLAEAAERISPYIHHTPLTSDEQNGFYLKWENLQITGSFKARGALNKVLSLQSWERSRGLVAASAGNHGQGVALAGRITNTQVIVFCSEHAVSSKVDAMRSLGAEVRQVPGGYGEAERAGLAFAKSSGAAWISPYNDGQVIAGQGTIGLEIQEDLGDIKEAAWIVPTSGGGLISGIGASLVNRAGRPHLIAVQAEASAFLHSIFYTGSQQGVPDRPTLADGLSGPVEDGSITIPLVMNMVDGFVLVSEAEIAQAMAYAWHYYDQRIEGSAAAALAALLFNKVSDRPAVVIISGGNIDREIHTRTIEEAGDQPFPIHP